MSCESSTKKAARTDPPASPGADPSAGFRDVWLLMTLAAVGFVLWRAWVCDDAFITFRYVENCLWGNGLVFNLGERVQGFTHPLWLLWLLAGSTVFDTYAVAVLGGLVCTGFLVWLLARRLRDFPHGSLVLLAGMAVLLSSRSFVEFQTSGLETPLANLLIVALFAMWPLRSEAAAGGLPIFSAGLVCSLLLVTRPDLIAICGPVLVWSGVQSLRVRPRVFGRFLAALTPAFAWYAFATIYYGTPLPNTAYAKVVFPPAVALTHGLHYLRDYAVHEPVQALVLTAVPVAAAVWIVRSCRTRACLWAGLCLPAGILLHVAYITWVGGDFMRGRFAVPALVAAVVLGSRLLGHVLPQVASRPVAAWVTARRPASLAWIVVLVAGGVSLYDWQPRTPSPERIEAEGGIADEYAWYAGEWDRPRFRPPESAPNERLLTWMALGQGLERYSSEHGPITIVWGVMGILPYYAGPQVSVVDVLGLTDAFVARCPADPASRVGHIGHDIPSEYYQARGAVNTLPHSVERLESLDSSLAVQARQMQQQVVWSDDQAKQLWDNVRVMTTGPLFSWKRLKAIPAYAFPHRPTFRPSALQSVPYPRPHEPETRISKTAELATNG